MTLPPRRTLIALLAGAVLAFPVGSSASSSKTGKSSTQKPTAQKRAAVKPGKARASRKTAYNPRRRHRPRPFRYRLARLKLQPERIEEIQRSLIQNGYLNQEPNGRWDEPTRDAMRRYQQAHGFPETGLPEAKSLLKLGLGPHPLPEELDPTAQARPESEAVPVPSSPPVPAKTDRPPGEQ